MDYAHGKGIKEAMISQQWFIVNIINIHMRDPFR
jgi:hypothetical protein